MILGIPAYTVLRVFAREFFYNFKAVQKITSGLAPPDIPTSVTAVHEEDFSEKRPVVKSRRFRRSIKSGNK